MNVCLFNTRRIRTVRTEPVEVQASQTAASTGSAKSFDKLRTNGVRAQFKPAHQTVAFHSGSPATNLRGIRHD